MEDEELREDKHGITLMQVLSVIFGRKILFLIVTVATLLVGFVGIKVFYNSSKEVYKATFNYSVEGLEDGTYIDGSKFDVRALISYDNLKAIVDSDSSFATIELDKLYSSNGIKFFETVTYKTVTNNAGVEEQKVDEEYYTITVLKKYFKSADQASKFVSAIASQPVTITNEIAEKTDYMNYLNLFDSSTIYENQVSYLQNQLTLLDGKYSDLIDNYGDVFTSSGKQLSDYQMFLNEYFQSNSFTTISDEISYNGYVKNYEESEQILLNEQKTLTREREVDKKKLADLEDQRDALLTKAGNLYSVELSEYNNAIINLTIRIQDVDDALDLIQLKLDNIALSQTDSDYKAKINDLEKRLNSFRDKLEEFTNQYTAIEKEVIKNYSVIYYDYSTIVIRDGGMGNAKAGVFSLAAGLFLACLINIILDGKKLTKKYQFIEVKEEKK